MAKSDALAEEAEQRRPDEEGRVPGRGHEPRASGGVAWILAGRGQGHRKAERAPQAPHISTPRAPSHNVGATMTTPIPTAATTALTRMTGARPNLSMPRPPLRRPIAIANPKKAKTIEPIAAVEP